MVSDEEAARIAQQLDRADRAVLQRWARALLADRRERISLLQQEARQLEHLRRRLRQASEYLDKLVVTARDLLGVPWPKRVPCPLCGAVVVGVRSEYRPGVGHVTVHVHPDGKACEAPGASGGPGDPSRP